MFSRAKRVEKVILGPEFFLLNWSKNGQNMAKSCFLGLKLVQSVQEVVVDPENI